MKKIISLITALTLSLFVFTGCISSKFEDLELDVPKMTVSSSSVNSNGIFYTITATDKDPNNPKGENRSPDLKWSGIPDAACYAAIMFDVSANWLHMFIPEITELGITEGEFSTTSSYVGPYPPQNSGRHEYRLEVFALKNKPHNLVFVIDHQQNYSDIVRALNRYNGEDGNVLARGYITGTYEYDDNITK